MSALTTFPFPLGPSDSNQVPPPLYVPSLQSSDSIDNDVDVGVMNVFVRLWDGLSESYRRVVLI